MTTAAAATLFLNETNYFLAKLITAAAAAALVLNDLAKSFTRAITAAATVEHVENLWRWTPTPVRTKHTLVFQQSLCAHNGLVG